jgi:multidrug efflux system membrane fusion protein
MAMPTREVAGTGAQSGERASRPWGWIALGVLVLALAVVWMRHSRSEQAASAGPASAAPRAVPVVAAPARQGDMPVYLTGLGSVTPFNTATVKSRVEGQIVTIAFTEGQFVHEGDLLVEIDPRPFEVQLTQAEGQLARDTAQLKDAQLTLGRFRELVEHGVVAKQDYDDKVAAAAQLEGMLKVDRGLIDNAKLQLTYSHVTAPISGRVGLRLVDVGNVVHPTDTTGIVIITQLKPIAVTFTIPEDDLPPVLAKLRASQRLPAEAYDRAGTTKIAAGTLLTVDNQIDRTTGTTRLKAEFPNDDETLFPNQFVNVRLLVDVRKEAVIVPSAAVQRGPQGTFVYAVKPDHTVEVRPVTLGPQTGSDAAIDKGVASGDVVVVDGVDKLHAGSLVEVSAPNTPAPAAATVPKGSAPAAPPA